MMIILRPVIGLASLILAWGLAIWVFSVPNYISPGPLGVAKAFGTNLDVLVKNLIPTMQAAVGGFVIGNIAAIILATIFVHWQRVREIYLPVAVFFNTIPIIALAPVVILIFGLGIASKIVVSAIVCFFPMLVNMIRGFESVSPSELELMRVMSASRREVFFRLRLPRSVPFLFAALRISATASVIGAIVAEWIGAELGLGVLIIQTTFDYRTELLYAAIATSSLLALSLFTIVVVAETFIVRWRTS
jgi:NitT/TauT family transport system permease protein